MLRRLDAPRRKDSSNRLSLADGRVERLPALAEELAARKPAVIVTGLATIAPEIMVRATRVIE